MNYIESLKLVNDMLDPSFDWDNWDGEDVDTTWRECAILVPHDEEGDWFSCGSAELTDTPKALYRVLWLMRPKSVDFSDMYKDSLLCIATPDKRFVATFDLFKYMAGVRFYCPKDLIGGRGTGIIAGAPGADNGWHCTDEVGNLFFNTVKAILEYKHMVYGGNDFEV